MAIDNIRTQVDRESQIRPNLEHPEIVDALRHGNIYEILKTPGVNRRDLEEYISNQHRVFQNQIVQDYQIYAEQGGIPPPELTAHFAVHNSEMTMTGDDRHLFKKDMAVLQATQAHFKGINKDTAPAPTAGGEDVAGMAEKDLANWNDLFSSLSSKAIDGQMMSDLKSKTAELNKEVQRMVSMVMSGQIDPEYVLIAAAKSNMLQNGTFFSWKGKRIALLNQEMDKASKELLKMNPNDAGYLKEQQMAAIKTRDGASQMQLEMMDIQKFSQNIANTLDWVNNAIRTFAQMRQTPTQAIAAR